MLTNVLNRDEDPLLKMRTIMNIFTIKNSVDIRPFFPTLLTEDILISNPKDELFSKEHKYFNTVFYNELKKHPLLMMNVVEVIKEFIHIHSLEYESVFALITGIIFANEDSATPIHFHHLKFTRVKDISDKYRKQIMKTFPSILPMKIKYNEFIKENNLIKPFYLNVDRENVLDSVWSIERLKEKMFKFQVIFSGEPAVDTNGGVTNEFIRLAFTSLMRKEMDLFDYRNGYYWFKYHKEISRDLIQKYKCVGILLSASILNSVYIPVRFPRYFYKKLLKRSTTVSDLALFDPGLYKFVQFLLNNDVQKSDNLDFTYVDSMSHSVINLMDFKDVTENQSFIPMKIKNESKQKYINNLRDWIFNRSINLAYQALIEGFNKVWLNQLLFDWFSLDEIDAIVSGGVVFNWDELKEAAVYSPPYEPQHKVIVWFWQYFDQLDDEGKKNVLKFVTGSSTFHPCGLKNIQLRFNKSFRKIPTAHVCLKLIELPEYDSFDELKKYCDLAFIYNEGFGLF